MRWAVGIFYAGLVTYVFVAGGLETGLVVLAAVLCLLVIMRPIDAGRAITDWAHLRFRGRRVSSSS
jgi:hypothetical protein